MHVTLRPAENEVRNLLEMFEFFLGERQLGKPIDALGEAVKDMRLIIGRILVDHFLSLPPAQEAKFTAALAAMLADRAATLPAERGDDRDYSDYCIGEILTTFEYAQEIKAAFPEDRILQKMMALDIPILRPFDYGLRGKLKLIPTKKRKIKYQ
jgi:hypothetical protein